MQCPRLNKHLALRGGEHSGCYLRGFCEGEEDLSSYELFAAIAPAPDAVLYHFVRSPNRSFRTRHSSPIRTMAQELRSEELRKIIDHVFLPPKLPQFQQEPRDSSLIIVTLQALDRFRNVVSVGSQALEKAAAALTAIRDINSGPDESVCRRTLGKMMSSLANEDVLAVKVGEQNAAILITRQGDKVVFEAFELSARNADVIGTGGRLTRSFPGLAVAVDWRIAQAVDSDFCTAISHAIGVMSDEPAPSMQARSKKSGHQHEESRDSAHPGLVSELLVGGVLRGFGSTVTVKSISKQTRDEVLWDNALLPWRRSAMWLLIRVVLQLMVVRAPHGSRLLYKEFMVFLMSTILERSLNLPLGSDMFHVMNAKISRRLHKLGNNGSANHNRISAEVHAVLSESYEIIQHRWMAVQAAEKENTFLRPFPTSTSIINAAVEIAALDEYIGSICENKMSSGRSDFQPTSQLLQLAPDSLPILPSALPLEYHYAIAQLQQIETWIAERLPAWLGDHNDPDTLGELHKVLVQYHSLAESLYEDNPEGTSTMLLTVFELWVACDQIACMSCSFLEDYDPDVTCDLLENLLLPSQLDMQGLYAVEEHLHRRRQCSSISTTHLFDIRADCGFPARYFDSSTLHQRLLSTICDQAERDRRAKQIEFDEKKAEYTRLKTLESQRQCELVVVVTDAFGDHQETETRHAQNCQRCRLKDQAAALNIDVHEWPLPADQTEAKGVVFELQVPQWFVHWREARQYLIVNVLKGVAPKYRPQPSYCLPSDDPHLSRTHYTGDVRRRIGLLSEVKPHVATHYRNKKIASTKKEAVCLRNGLRYDYYDSADGAYLGQIVCSDQMVRACTYRLPAKCQGMQRYLFRPAVQPDGIAPNTVIACQDDCPHATTIEEYKDLAMIPLGRHIQWSHVLLQVAMPEVDFKKSETYLFILQCLYQAGPRSEDVLRQNHLDCGDIRFTHRLIDQVRKSLERVSENWDSLHALHLFVHIITRISSLNDEGRQSCFDLLERARDIAMVWMSRLRDRARETGSVSDRTAFATRKASIAMVCGCTFDLDEPHLSAVLRSPKAASTLIQCSILEQQGRSEIASDDVITGLLTLRFKKVLHRAHQALCQNHDGLDDAVERIWSAYSPSVDRWQSGGQASEWVFTSIVPKGTTATAIVHYNAVSGDLLVDGCPLDRPPREFQEQPLFAILFGNNPVEVMPTTAMAGFSFCTLERFGGYTVYLGMSATGCGLGAHLRVRVTDGSSSHEVLPRDVLEGSYPAFFVDSYVHWYDFGSGTVKFRPADTPWTSGTVDSLSMHPCEGGRGRVLTEDGSTVLGLKHPHFEAISSILAPLACDVDVHVRIKSFRSHVVVPRLRLAFSMEPGTCELISHEFPNMKVAADQAIGTLVGLQSKLVLERRTDGRRKLLLPEGSVHYRLKQGYPVVHIARQSMSVVHAFEVDEDLGRLIDSGSVRAKLLLAYLHALTSNCLPDPFTGHTGTEQALTILNSAAMRSCHLLTADEAEMVARICRLTPGRTYYPRDMRVMQTVSWDPGLSFLSQHDGFLTAARNIDDQTRRAAVFRLGPLPQSPDFSFADDHLTARDRIRSSAFRISGYGAEEYTTDDDRQYEARDRSQGSPRAERAASISGLFDRGFASTFSPAEVRDHAWSSMKDAARVNGADSLFDPTHLVYNTSQLQDWETFVWENWLAIHRWMREDGHNHTNRFTLATCLSTMAFSDTGDVRTLQALAICADVPLTSALEFRDVKAFFPSDGKDCTKSNLRKIVIKYLLPFGSSPEFYLERMQHESKRDFDERRHMSFQRRQKAVVDTIVDQLAAEWRRKTPSNAQLSASLGAATYVDLSLAMRELEQSFLSWYNNGVLFQYLESLEGNIASRPREAFRFPSVRVARAGTHPSVRGFISREDMFFPEAPDTSTIPKSPEPLLFQQQSDEEPSKRPVEYRLESLIESLEGNGTTSAYETKYNQGLRQSLAAMKKLADENGDVKVVCPPCEVLVDYLTQCREHAVAIYEAILLALKSSIRTVGLLAVGHFPRLSHSLLLQQLSRVGWMGLTDGWRAWIVALGVAVTGVQRARRLIEVVAVHGDPTGDLENGGHTTWDPACYPEFLLLEVESGLMIREAQEQIAARMRTPPRNQNTTMQMHMGEGKTSMIVPMCATSLADGTRLMRVIVAKAQSKQMTQMLTAKLGGLINRRLYHMPISRDLRFDVSAARSVAAMVHECRIQGGVLLAQPEHLLSLQLMVCEAHLSGQTDLFNVLMSILTFFDDHARDIVDESDENFNVRLELIYTIGTQRMVEYSPGRWILFQRVLEIVGDVAAALESVVPRAISIRRHVARGFPRIRILQAEAGPRLIEGVVEEICTRSIRGLPVGTQPPALRRAIRDYISCAEPTAAVVNTVEDSSFWTGSTRPILLLLRGLLANGLLTFVLAQKRWRVNYGLATRCPPTRLAVPYRARDCPAPRSEFSHPDVIIVLTLLSYYYGGLHDDDLFAAFEHLMNSDAGELEYQAWVRDANELPPGLRQLQSINLEDKTYCVAHLFPPLRHAKSVIDYFLAKFVFPKEMREFPSKLSSSGWDIGKPTGQLLTGFSGTCDSRHLLPSDVRHVDLEAQQHTNAMVLEYLLRPDNGIRQMLGPAKLNDVTDAQHVISIAVTISPPVQVILDVGAQILEMSNLTFATTWLRACDDVAKEATVFVNEDDEICVVDRSGRVDLLHTSSFIGRMTACLVFLDEAHTRGIDLRLPGDYRALVTLGPHLTKDRLVQACMRMRKLGRGQTVVFCVPEEVRDKIAEQVGHRTEQAMELADILRWSISETHTDIRNNIPLWAIQGNRFARHAPVWEGAVENPNSLQSKQLLEDEAQTIEQRYRPHAHSDDVLDHSVPAHPLQHRIAAHCQRFDGVHRSMSTLQEEQERELSPEAEQERQVQRPPAAEPAIRHLHQDVVNFATHGNILPRSEAYKPAFEALRNTSIGRSFDVSQFDGDRKLLVTADFVNTIRHKYVDGDTDDFQRPVRWVLTRLNADGSEVDCMMVISPYEANRLYVRMKDARRTTLHLYKPWCNVTYDAIDRLDLHTVPHRAPPPVVPTSLAVRLGLFAGQLYLSSYHDYLAICEYLGLWTKDLTEEMEAAGWQIEADRFIKRDGNGRTGGSSGIRQSPLSFLRDLMSIRRSGQSISRTHMGLLLDGQVLNPQEFDNAAHKM